MLCYVNVERDPVLVCVSFAVLNNIMWVLVRWLNSALLV